MNYKKLFWGLAIMAALFAALMLVGCSGDDCGFNCEDGCACGLACNGHGGCVGCPYMDGCTVVGCNTCDTFGSCVGCGIEDGDIDMYTEKNEYAVGDTAIVYVSVGDGWDDVADAAYIEVVEDTTKSAKIKRVDDYLEVTAKNPGEVFIEAKLGDYAGYITIIFVSQESMLDGFGITLSNDQSVLYTGQEYYLSVDSKKSGIGIESDKVKYSLTNNTAEAFVSGNYITGAKEGSVTVTASYEFYGQTFTSTLDLYFEGVGIKMREEGTLAIGNKVALGYDITGGAGYGNDMSYIRFDVLSGDATITQENGTYYIVAVSVGDVVVKATYSNHTPPLTATKTLTFTTQGFKIGSDESEFYVGHAVPLKVTENNIALNEANVVYKVVSGSATLEGNVLTASAPGKVVVSATCKHNGAELVSNDFSINFTYDQNALSEPADLLRLNNSAETYYLINDIDLSSYASWTPIENFTGKLIGNGHKIKGLKIVVNNLETNKGLFAVLGGSVEDLSLDGAIDARGEATNIGLICGYNKGTIKKVSVSGRIDAEYGSKVGGIAGYSDTAYITDCTSNVYIEAKDYVGGIAGQAFAVRNSEARIENLTNNAEIRGISYVGGLFGSLKPQATSGTAEIAVTGCKNTAPIMGSKDYVGGLFGEIHGEATAPLFISGCDNTAPVSGVKYVGGIMGYSLRYLKHITLSTNTADVTGDIYVGSIAGYVNTGCVLKDLKNSVTVTGSAYVGGIVGYGGRMENCENNGQIVAVNYKLEGSTAVSYVGGIAGYAENINGCVNNADIKVPYGGRYVGGIVGYLHSTRAATDTISDNNNYGEVTGTSYVGGIAGAVVAQDGPSVTLTCYNNKNKGTAVTGSDEIVGGIFGYVEFTSTAKLKISDCHNEAEVVGKDNVGGIVGKANYYLEEIMICTNTGNVTGNKYVGGFAGYADGAMMRGLKNSVTVTGKAYVGGVAGYTYRVENCENNGELVIKSYMLDENNNRISYVGGIAGYSQGAVDCKNNSDINVANGGSYVGGIVGYLEAIRSSEIEVSGNTNYAEVTGTSYVGGLAGKISLPRVSTSQTVTVSENKNLGTITASENYAGGMFGSAAGHHFTSGSGVTWGSYTSMLQIMYSENEADVSGNDYVGGIVGCCESYVVKEETIWNTNISIADISAKGENSGKLYGYMG